MPRRRSPFARLFADLAGALGKIGVDWYLFGTQAALLYGATRVTADVDVTVRLGTRAVDELIASLRDKGFVLRINSPSHACGVRREHVGDAQRELVGGR